MNLSKILSRRKLFVVSIAGAALCIGIAYFAYRNQKENISVLPTVNTAYNQEGVSSPLPVRLKISKINVDSAIDYVGLTAEGRMDVPKGPMSVGWYNLGPRPGEEGSSVIDGHSGYKDDKPAAFDDLHKLVKGDKIYIEDEKGDIVTFVVRESQSFGKDESVPNVFGSSDGKAHLNLITCVGDWNEREKTHSKRLVVFADKEEAPVTY